MNTKTMTGEILDAEIVGQDSPEQSGEIALIDVGQFKLPAPVEFETKLKGAFAKMYAGIDEKLATRTVDLTTKKGREQIASEAFAISRLKTKTAALANKLTEEQRAIIDAVVTERKTMEAELDKRRDLARQPLTEWEEGAKKIEAAAKAAKAFMLSIRAQTVEGVMVADMNSVQLALLLNMRQQLIFSAEEYGDAAEELQELNGSTVQWLSDAVATAQKAEADARELEDLRKMRAEKEAREAAEKEAADLRASQDEQAEKAVEDLGDFSQEWQRLCSPESAVISHSSLILGALQRTREFDYRADVFGSHNLDRIERARLEAIATVQALADQALAQEAETARLEAERLAEEAAEHQRQIEAKARADAAAEAEAAIKRAEQAAEQAKIDAAAEIQRQQEAFAAQQAREALEREQEAQRLAHEAKAKADAEAEAERIRTEDKEHRGKINSQILRALTSVEDGMSLDIDQAKQVVRAILRGQVPNTKIEY